MCNTNNMILAINTGSTSTKIAIFFEENLIVKKELFIEAELLSQFNETIEQLELRIKMVNDFLIQENVNVNNIDIIVARGGTIPSSEGGAYEVNKLMLDTLHYAPMAQHASSLSCMIAYKLAESLNIPVIIYDPPGTDEFDSVARITGLPEVSILPVSHVLNTRMVAREVAKKIGRPYEECNFIVAHMGGGFSINVHKKGMIVDCIYDDMGPMSPTRAGRLPTRFLAKLCYSGKYTYQQMRKMLTAEGGIMAHLGTQNLQEIEKRILNESDEKAKEIYYAMAYQTAKGIAELSAVVCGNVDSIILTGGAAHSNLLTKWIRERIRFIAQVEVIPGEREMEALALGGLRVLKGIEKAKTYDIVPYGFKSIEEFYNSINK